jgi:hypothetical protein
MAKKHTYTAEISGITLTRKTEKTYTHAWASLLDGKIKESGFSSSLELATKAGTNSIKSYVQAAKFRPELSKSESDYSLKISPTTIQ